MSTSPEIKVLLIIAAGAALTGFGISFLADKKTHELIAWINATFPDQWSALPKFQQQWLKGAAIEGLRQRGLKNEGEFVQRYDEIRRLRRWMIVSIVAGSTAIAIVIFGTQYGGWSF